MIIYHQKQNQSMLMRVNWDGTHPCLYIHPISSIARIGGVASQIIEMIPKMCGEDSTMDCTKIPYAIYGIMTILGCILMFALPETKDQSSPETISEGNQFGKVCF